MRINRTDREILLFLILSCILWYGCRTSSSSVKKEKEASAVSSEEKESVFLQKALIEMPRFDCLSSKMNLKVTMTGEKEISGSGIFKMKKDRVIQLSVSALGLFEVLRVEFTPQEICVVNRIEKSYARVPYSDFPIFKEVGVDFYTLQALFMNQLFTVGKEREEPAPNRFSLTYGVQQTMLSPQPYGETDVCFYIDAGGRVTQTIMAFRKSFQIDWSYRNFSKIEETTFPRIMQLTADGGKGRFSLLFSFNNCKTENFRWEPMKVSSSYKPMKIEKLLPKL